jgi:hypothetical protein
MMGMGFESAAVRVLMVIGWGLCASSTLRAATVADYYFNGPIDYTVAGQTLTVNTGSQGAELISSTGLPAPFAVVPTGQPGSNIAGSEVLLSMSLVAGSVADNGFATTASFSTPAGYQASLYLGNGSGGTATSPVLKGWLSNMQVSGFDGGNTGVLTGYLHPTGGLAYSYFSDPSDVIALDFNLSTDFSSSMYGASFTGQINGQVESAPAPVPLPAALPLLLCGLGFLGTAVKRRSIPASSP